MKEKIKALAKYLSCKQKEIEVSNYDDNTFNYGNQEYLVLTDEEADKLVAERIRQDLWAFNANFIIRHCKNYDDMDCFEFNAAVESLQNAQKTECENLNGLVYALIDNLNEFIEDAVNADGRGHFLAWYDGYENEENGFYIYRTN